MYHEESLGSGDNKVVCILGLWRWRYENIRIQEHWHKGPLGGSDVEQRKAILSFFRALWYLYSSTLCTNRIPTMPPSLSPAPLLRLSLVTFLLHPTTTENFKTSLDSLSPLSPLLLFFPTPPAHQLLCLIAAPPSGNSVGRATRSTGTVPGRFHCRFPWGVGASSWVVSFGRTAASTPYPLFLAAKADRISPPLSFCWWRRNPKTPKAPRGFRIPHPWVSGWPAGDPA